MDANHVKSHDHILKAREALRHGDKKSARELGEQAALLTPELEDAWLVLAASDPDPREALAYARKALELKPESTRAHRAVEWALQQAKQAPAEKDRADVRREGQTAPAIPVNKNLQKKTIPPVETIQNNAVTAFPRFLPRTVEPQAQPESKPRDWMWVYAAAAGLLVCVVLAVGAWSVFSSPVFTSLFNNASASTHEELWATVNVPKPSVTSIDVSVFASSATTPDAPLIANESSADISPTTTVPDVPALADAPTSIPTDESTSLPQVTETPGVMAMEIVVDTPTNQFVPPNPNAPKPSVASNGATRWIDVDLTNQRVYAYEGETMVNSFLVSTGTWLTPTVTGQYKIYVKYEKANMHGPGYFLPDVPYVMYFYKGYGLHGTYWHSNFGTPMSHGCINLETGNAGWLFNWAKVGTVVNVHY